MKLRTAIIAILAVTASGSVQAATTPQSKPAHSAPSVRSGAAISAECAMCHGSNGISVAENIPNLAGQRYGYLFSQLQKFKTGTRKSPLMNQMAEPLSKQQMQDLAAYYASIPVEVEKPRLTKNPVTAGK